MWFLCIFTHFKKIKKLKKEKKSYYLPYVQSEKDTKLLLQSQDI